MTPEEVKKAFEQLKEEGMDDNDMLVALGRMFQNGDITKDQLGALIYELGYEFTDEFASKSDEEAKNGLFKDDDEKPEEPESDEKKDEEPEDKPESEDEPEEKPEDEDEDEDERGKAMSLFGR